MQCHANRHVLDGRRRFVLRPNADVNVRPVCPGPEQTWSLVTMFMLQAASSEVAAARSNILACSPSKPVASIQALLLFSRVLALSRFCASAMMCVSRHLARGGRWRRLLTRAPTRRSELGRVEHTS